MRTNFGAKPWFYPLPVLIVGTYNPDGTANNIYRALGEKTGNAFWDGGRLK